MMAASRYRDPLPRIDFAAVAASLGDLRAVVEAELGPPDRAGKWSCPFHDDRTPSFHIWVDHFHCYGCGEHGDGVHWVARREGLSPAQAARRIDPSVLTADDVNTWRLDHPARSHLPEPPRPDPRGIEPRLDCWRDPEWQETLSGLVRLGEANLWSSAGRPALGWLRRRGLADVTIRRFRLGFLSADARTYPVAALLAREGRPRGLYAPRGVTIPWLAPGAWHSESDGEPDGPRWVGMNVRRLAADVDDELPDGVPKCLAVAGSRRGYLYPFPTIERTQGASPMLLVEGEFDALMGMQEVGHILHVATAGSASVRILPRETQASLARCPRLFLALDHDVAGAEGCRAWREAYPQKSLRVLLPLGKDLNDFILAGGDLVGWIGEVLAGLGRRWSAPLTGSP